MTETFTVSTSTELYAALSRAQGGETILLASGNYGKLVLDSKSGFDIAFAEPVTIVSADAGNPAVLSGMDVDGAANLTLDGLVFDYAFSQGQPMWASPFQIADSENITIRNSVFDGDVVTNGSEEDNGYGNGYGLKVGGSTGIVIENNEFFDFNRGIVMGENTDTVISGNDLHAIRSDGMDFVAMTGVVIEDNHIHDFTRSMSSGDHADMIQFWTNGSGTPSTDIEIRGNLLDIGEGDPTQSIFMRNDMVDSGLAGDEMFYRNVLIENNTIYNAHSNGIVLGEAVGVVIRNNSVLHADGRNADGADSTVEIPRITVSGSSSDVEISNNVTSSVGLVQDRADWVYSNNVLVQDQNAHADNYYADIFVFSTLDTEAGANRYTAQQGGILDSLDAGSLRTAYDPSQAISGFNVSGEDTGAGTRMFSVQTGIDLQGGVPDLTYNWDFGDGKKMTGAEVSHAFGTPGHYDVRLTVSLAGAVLQTETAQVAIADTRLVSIDQSGAITGYTFGEAFLINDLGTDGGVVLGAHGSAASIGANHLGALAGADTFRITFDLQAAGEGSAGEVFRMKDAFIVSVENDGDLQVRLFLEGQPELRLRADAAGLNDHASHEVTIVAEDGRIAIIVDDAELASANLAAPLKTAGTDWLSIGNPWNTKNFEGTVSQFSISMDPHKDVWTQDAQAVDATAIAATLPDDAATFELAMAIPVAVSPLSELDLLYASSHEEGGGATGSPIDLGRQYGLEASNTVGFSVEFNRDSLGAADARLVWNHMKVGLELVNDGLRLRVATADQGFKMVSIKDLGLNDLERHTAIVLVDGETDRIQVVLDGDIVLDRQDIDVEMVGAGGREWGWSVGGASGHNLIGDITEFRLDDQFHFVQDLPWM